jgi:hypothetical protein
MAMMAQYNDALRSFVSSNGSMAKPEFSVITGSDPIKKFGYRSCNESPDWAGRLLGAHRSPCHRPRPGAWKLATCSRGWQEPGDAERREKTPSNVAFMSRRVAWSQREPLKINENCRDKTQHEKRRRWEQYRINFLYVSIGYRGADGGTLRATAQLTVFA